MKMAKKFGITQSSVFRYETGATMIPPELLMKYADYL
jgi:transcriptional regulator with XRE-family HTH domain